MITHSKHATIRSLMRLMTGLWLVAALLLCTTAAPAAPTAPRAKASANAVDKTPYTVVTLKQGENAALIAQREHLSMAELARINQGFLPPGISLAHLMVGQQLCIPSADARINALFIHGDEARTMRQALGAPKPTATTGTASGSKLGSLAQSLGNALNTRDSDDRGEALRSASDSALLGEANSRFNQGVGQALGTLGNARINLGADRNMDFDGAEISLLHPWMENERRLLYSQSSVHREDGRTYANLGVGQRHFLASGKMLGYNAFIDQDLTGHNTRASLGLEAWADYLKLGTNVYGGLTNWHDSIKLDGYEERPANGFDLQLEGYLPSFPQLGAKLKYEQYYGDKVGLFGDSLDDLQHNPSATTVGLNYTPVPLMTVGIDYSAGQGGKHEASAKVDFNVSLDQPLSTQLNPAKVAARRTVKGSKHDFVERNNKIVLEYRKKDHISFSLPALITGKARSALDVPYSVSAQSGVASVDIQSPELVAAGGQITVGDGMFTLTMPPLLPVNTYTLTGSAVSRGGAKSQPAVSTVSVISPVSLSARLDTPELPAALNQTTQLHVNLTNDETHQPYNLYAQGGALSFNVVRKKDARLRAGIPHDYSATKVDNVNIDENGQVTATVTAGNQPGTDIIEIYAERQQLPDIKVGSVTLTLTSLDTQGAHINLTPGQDNARADGVATDSLSLVASDANNVPMINQKVYLSDDLDDDAFKDINPLYPDGDGKAEAAFHSLKDGAHTISASFAPGGASVASIRLHFNSSIAAASTLEAIPAIVEADGATPATLTLVAKNRAGQPLTDLLTTGRLGFAPASPVGGVTIGALSGGANGQYQAIVTGDAEVRGQSVQFVPLLDGQPVPGVTATLDFTNPVLSLAESSFISNKARIQADGIDAAALTIIARNKAGQPVSGLKDQLSIVADLPQGVTITEISEAGGSGSYNAMLRGTENKNPLKVSAKLDNRVIKQPLELQLSLDVDHNNSGTSMSVAPATIESDGRQQATLTFVAKNNTGTSVTGLGSRLRFVQTGNLANLQIDGISENPPGTYSAKLYGTHAGPAVIEARIDDTAVSGKSATINLTPLQTNAGMSDLSLDHPSIEADNVHSATLTFKPVNQQGVPLLGLDAAHLQFVEINSPPLTGLTIGTVTEPTAGQYQAILHGSQAGSTQIQPVVNGVAVAKTVELTLTAMQAEEGASQLALLPNNIQADGVSTAELSFTPINARGKPLLGLSDRLTFVANPPTATIGTISETNGVYTAKVSGSVVGTITLKPLIDGRPVGNLHQDLQLAQLEPDARQSSFTLDPASVLADGTASVTATFIAHNERGVAVPLTAMPGLKFGFLGVTGLDVSAIVDEGGGKYTATIRGHQPGIAQLAPEIDGTAMTSLQQRLTLQALTPDAHKSAFTANPASIEADDEALSTLTFDAKTDQNQSVVGLGDGLKFVTTQAGVTMSKIQEGPAGTYTATLHGVTPGTASVDALVNGTKVKTIEVQLTPLILAPTRSSFASDVSQIEADGVSHATLTLIAKNDRDYLIGGLSSRLRFVLSGGSATIDTIQELSTGVYVATLHGLTATTVTVTPQLDSAAIGLSSATVELQPLQIDIEKSSFTIAPTFSIDNQDALTVTLKNRNNVGIAGKTITATLDSTQSRLSEFHDNGDGSYSAELKDTVPEEILLRLSAEHTAINYDDGQGGRNSSTVVRSLAGAFSPTMSRAAVEPTVVAGQQTSIVLSPRDQYGNAIKMTKAQLGVNASIAGGSVTEGTFTDEQNGSYLMTFSTTKAGALQWHWAPDGMVVPASSFSGGSDGHGTTSVLADAIDPGHTTAEVTVRLYQNQDATITMHPQDRYGNAVTLSAGELSGKVTGVNAGMNYSAGSFRDLGNHAYSMSINPSEIGVLNWSWMIGGQALPASQYQGAAQNKTAVASRYFAMKVHCDGLYVCILKYNGQELTTFKKGDTTEKVIDKVERNIQANPTITFDFKATGGQDSRDHCTYDSNAPGGTALMTGTTAYVAGSPKLGPHVACNRL